MCSQRDRLVCDIAIVRELTKPPYLECLLVMMRAHKSIQMSAQAHTYVLLS